MHSSISICNLNAGEFWDETSWLKLAIDRSIGTHDFCFNSSDERERERARWRTLRVENERKLNRKHTQTHTNTNTNTDTQSNALCRSINFFSNIMTHRGSTHCNHPDSYSHTSQSIPTISSYNDHPYSSALDRQLQFFPKICKL
jgi:hypothetical protein